MLGLVATPMSTSAGAISRIDLRRIGTHTDFWYPLAWSHELKARKPLGRNFAGEPIVLYRGQSGQVFALEDRCAHRQVPLHLGVVAGEILKCGYHGWAYDCAGKCVDVPYLGREKLPNGVKTYPVREIDGVIFVFPGDSALADARAPASLGSFADRRYRTRRLDRKVACHYTFMHENLFDMNHQFLHRKNMGMIRASCLGKRKGADWCEVDYTFSRTAGRGSLGEAAILNVRRPKHESADRDVMTHPHRISLSAFAILGERQTGRSGAGCVARLYAPGSTSAHQPHLRLSLGEEAEDSGPHPCGMALRVLVHGEHFCARTRTSSSTNSAPTTRRVRTGTTRCFPPFVICANCLPVAACRIKKKQRRQSEAARRPRHPARPPKIQNNAATTFWPP